MDFEYAQPERGQEEYIRHLAPSNILSRLEQKNIYCVVAVAREDDGRTVVALMMGRWKPKEHVMDLLWLYVEEECRGRGIATNLLRMLFQAARKCMAKKFRAQWYLELAGEGTSIEVAAFLKSRGFLLKERSNGPWIITGETFREEDFVIKSRIRVEKNKDKTVPLTEISLAELGKCMAALAPGETYPDETVEPGISCVVRDSEGWKGILIIRRYGNMYEPVIFHAVNKHVEMQLLVGMARRLDETIKPTDYIRIKERPKLMAEWADKIFPQLHRQKVIVAEADL